MPITDGAQKWSAVSLSATVPFARDLGSGGEWQQWFRRTVLIAEDTILGTDTTTLDVGGKRRQPLQIVAVFDTDEARQALVDLEGVAITLNGPMGRSQPAVLEESEPRMRDDGAYLLDCTFRAA